MTHDLPALWLIPAGHSPLGLARLYDGAVVWLSGGPDGCSTRLYDGAVVWLSGGPDGCSTRLYDGAVVWLSRGPEDYGPGPLPLLVVRVSRVDDNCVPNNPSPLLADCACPASLLWGRQEARSVRLAR